VTATPDGPVRPSSRPPAPLTVAASLVGIEALGYLVYGITELAVLDTERAQMGATTAVFFLLYGAGLGYAGWAVYQLRSWARAPIVMVQIIQLLLAWNFRAGSTTGVAVGLAVVALVVLAGIFHPQSLDALAGEDHSTRP
jgi:hypothetical protein